MMTSVHTNLNTCTGDPDIRASLIQWHFHHGGCSCADPFQNCSDHCSCETCVPMGPRGN